MFISYFLEYFILIIKATSENEGFEDEKNKNFEKKLNKKRKENKRLEKQVRKLREKIESLEKPESFEKGLQKIAKN